MSNAPYLTGAQVQLPAFSGGGTQLVLPVDEAVVLSLAAKEDKNQKGVPGGYAPLDANAKVPVANLPDQTSLDAEVDAKVATHNSSTTNVHGITNTANLEYATNKNAANGYAGLDSGGKIFLSQLPDANAIESEAIAFAIALG